MPNRPPSDVADWVAARGRWLNWYCLRLERHGISRADLNQVYGGAFNSFFAFLEQSIEELFLGALTGRFLYGRADVQPLASFRTVTVARQVVYGPNRRYADWLPWDLTKSRATIFFARGTPFADLPPDDVARLNRLTVVRNALSHQSRYALSRFTEQFVNGKVLPPDQRSPAGYLSGRHAAGQSRLDFLLSEGVAAVRHLCQ
jgi:hypothetical protein